MSTQRQKKLAKAIVENAIAKKPKNKKDLLVSTGYSIITAESIAGEIIDSKGVKKELTQLGFTVEGADGVVEKILYNGKSEKTQLTAANLVYERLGAKAPDKSINVNVSVMDDEAINDLAIRLNKEMTDEVHERNGISGNGEISGTVAEEVRDENGEGTTT